MSALELKSALGEKYFNSLTKVAIVRNPYSYLVSRYHWSIAAAKFHNKKDISKLSFANWIKKYPSTINENVKLIEVDGHFVELKLLNMKILITIFMLLKININSLAYKIYLIIQKLKLVLIKNKANIDELLMIIHSLNLYIS